MSTATNAGAFLVASSVSRTIGSGIVSRYSSPSNAMISGYGVALAS